MTERLPGEAEAAPTPDLEYDLAHEVTIPLDLDLDLEPRHGEPVQVSTRTEHDGDYGYDMAHDIPQL